jgi:chromosomal replication initiation ATPase DnaA
VTQLALDFPRRTALGRADFLVSACNVDALGWVERWPDWPTPALLIHGPAGSGKTHLAHLWQARSGAVIVPAEALQRPEPAMEAAAAAPAIAVEDAEAAPEVPLLHLHNWCCERGAPLLLLSRHAAGAWPIGLPDLASRLRSLPSVGIAAPDDRLLGAVLIKHFIDRGLHVAPGVIAYLVRRMERSFAATAELAAVLDRLAMGSGGAVTIPLARRVLGQAA